MRVIFGLVVADVDADFTVTPKTPRRAQNERKRRDFTR